MRRLAVSILLSLSLSVALAAPALAGEKVEGDGYEFRLAPGFTEMMSMEGGGGMKMNMKASFGCLPVEGMPEMKAYMAGGSQLSGMVMVARVNLTRKITTAGELGLDQIEKLKSQMPDGVDIRATKVGGCDAVEITVQQEDYSGDRTTRMVSIAGGDYVVVLLMTTSDEAFPNSTAMWSSMITSMKVEPGINKLLLFGIVGVAGLFGLWFLGRFKSRPTSDVPDYTGRFKKDGEVATGPGFPPREGVETGKRPKVLASRPEMGMPEPGRMSTDPAPAPARPPTGAPDGGFASDGASAPVRTPTSPAVTRPAPAEQQSRPGLRATRGESGRWGQ